MAEWKLDRDCMAHKACIIYYWPFRKTFADLEQVWDEEQV